MLAWLKALKAHECWLGRPPRVLLAGSCMACTSCQVIPRVEICGGLPLLSCDA